MDRNHEVEGELHTFHKLREINGKVEIQRRVESSWRGEKQPLLKMMQKIRKLPLREGNRMRGSGSNMSTE